MNIIPIQNEFKMKLGISTSVLFDMSEPDAIWRAEQKGDVPQGSYRRYMMENIDKELPPHPQMFAWLKGCMDVEGYQFALMSKNSALTGMRAINTLVKHGLIPEQFVFTNGAPIAEYCRVYDIDMFLTANADDVRTANELGVSSAQISHARDLTEVDIESLLMQDTKPIPLYTKPRLVSEEDVPSDQQDKDKQKKRQKSKSKEEFNTHGSKVNVAFDFDKVLAGPESDDYFAAVNFDVLKYRQHEMERLHVEMQRAPWFQTYERLMKQGRGSHLVHINTARGAAAAFRMFYTLSSWGIEPNGEIHCMSGEDKTPILQILQKRYGNILFLDDGQKNVDRAKKAGIATGLVPSENPKTYLGA
jgi:hypothetical protein